MDVVPASCVPPDFKKIPQDLSCRSSRCRSVGACVCVRAHGDAHRTRERPAPGKASRRTATPRTTSIGCRGDEADATARDVSRRWRISRVSTVANHVHRPLAYVPRPPRPAAAAAAAAARSGTRDACWYVPARLLGWK
jgi:hypothetical protein